ncbi:MAG: hypothetical protein N2112_09630 [Gemmataceae bacterium]|nr:hypothetical protein [Gemmataceae bacterium]
MIFRWLLIPTILAGGVGVVAIADNTSGKSTPAGEGPPAKASNEVELVESIIKARKDYLTGLENLRSYYQSTSDLEKQKWVEEEMRAYHRMMKYSYRLDVQDVPPPTLPPKQNIPEANNLFRRAMEYKGRGGDIPLDDQRRAEILLHQILTKYPESDKIAEVAYHLGDIYENYKPQPQYHRAAAYFERSFQWNKSSSTDARIRAARLYDYQIQSRDKAKELYKAVMNHDTEPKRVQEAEKRLRELSLGRTR